MSKQHIIYSSQNKKKKPEKKLAYPRRNPPPHFRFRPVEDGRVLTAIYMHDGVLSRDQLKAMFWQEQTERAMELRLHYMYHHAFLRWPNREQRRRRGIPKPIVWLGWRGALWVAAQQGVQVDEPKNDGEYQMRLLAKRLRNEGFRWVQEPRWTQLEHDLGVTDWRMQLDKDIATVTRTDKQTGEILPRFQIEEQLLEGEFRLEKDEVTYKGRRRDGSIEMTKDKHNPQPVIRKKQIIPDWFGVIVDRALQAQGETRCRQRLLLEYDNSTHSNTAFAINKVVPGIAYIKSPEYKTRFGYNNGTWLVVTKSMSRLHFLLRQTYQVAGRTPWFLFSTQELCKQKNMLTDAVWWEVQEEMGEPITLFNSDL